MRDKLQRTLERLGRLDWLETEMAAWQDDVEATRSRERWWKVSGISGLSRRSLAVVRELWRGARAKRAAATAPPRRVLRDDLIVELAKRRSADPKQIRACAAWNGATCSGLLPKLAEAVGGRWQFPTKNAPAIHSAKCRRSSMCWGSFFVGSEQHLPRGRGGAQHRRHRQRRARPGRLSLEDGRLRHRRPPCSVAAGGPKWSADLIEDLLDGKVSVRIHDPLAEEPLAFEAVKP